MAEKCTGKFCGFYEAFFRVPVFIVTNHQITRGSRESTCLGSPMLIFFNRPVKRQRGQRKEVLSGLKSNGPAGTRSWAQDEISEQEESGLVLFGPQPWLNFGQPLECWTYIPF
ncbi:uncharacterized protein LOC119990320 [Tripterygium wilfordii]|uniref:uncharacterized protein LOC119990320 n=1 Tax=Tripterygium wilfordii TaxID=458696 RepID=UPI0018F7F0D1|nr:uncharacterized protein LOC119990320 [Tripterygium wilfordii]